MRGRWVISNPVTYIYLAYELLIEPIGYVKVLFKKIMEHRIQHLGYLSHSIISTKYTQIYSTHQTKYNSLRHQSYHQ